MLQGLILIEPLRIKLRVKSHQFKSLHGVWCALGWVAFAWCLLFYQLHTPYDHPEFLEIWWLRRRFSPNGVSTCNFNSHNFPRIDVNYNTNSGLCPCLSNQQVISPSSIVLPYYQVVNTAQRACLSHRNRETARVSRNLSFIHTWY